MPELGELVAVRLQPQVGQQAGVHLRVQGLDPAVQALREAGHLLDRGDRQAGVGDGPGGRPVETISTPAVDQGLRRVRPGRSCRTPRPAPAGSAGAGLASCHVHGHLSVVDLPRPGGEPVGDVHQQVALGDLDPFVQDLHGVVVAPPAPPPGRRITPVSTPASTRNTVAPVILTPYASASRGPCMPGEDGQQRRMGVDHPAAERGQEAGPTSFMKPALITRSGAYAATSVGQRRGPSRPGSGGRRRPATKVGMPGRGGPVEPGDAGPVGADGDDLRRRRRGRGWRRSGPAAGCRCRR